MHSSLLMRLLQPCLYPPRILPSVGQKPAATHCSLFHVPHCCPVLFVCVSLSHFNLLLSLSHCIIFYVFKLHTNSIGEYIRAALTRWKCTVPSDLSLCEGHMEVCMHACTVIMSENWHVILWESAYSMPSNQIISNLSFLQRCLFFF